MQPIKYIRIDFVGTGTAASIGLAFDNFWAYGCKRDGRVTVTC